MFELKRFAVFMLVFNCILKSRVFFGWLLFNLYVTVCLVASCDHSAVHGHSGELTVHSRAGSSHPSCLSAVLCSAALMDPQNTIINVHIIELNICFLGVIELSPLIDDEHLCWKGVCLLRSIGNVYVVFCFLLLFLYIYIVISLFFIPEFCIGNVLLKSKVLAKLTLQVFLRLKELHFYVHFMSFWWNMSCKLACIIRALWLLCFFPNCKEIHGILFFFFKKI